MSKRTAPGGEPTDELREVLHNIVDSCANPNHLVEVYYWCCESELVHFMRRFMALPDDVRKVLCSFLAMAKDNPCAVKISMGQNGEMTLTSPDVTEAIHLITAGQPKGESMH